MNDKAAQPANPVDDLFQWFRDQEPTWTSWAVGLILAITCAWIGLRGLYAWWRGEPPRPKDMVPSLLGAVGYFVFGGWVLIAFVVRGFPG